MEKLVYLPFDKFFPVEKELVNSKVFLSLTNSAKNIYFLLWTKTWFVASEPNKKGRDKRYYISNNGEIVLLYSEIVERCGYSDSTISKAIKELSEKGFIDITRPGIGACRIESRYAISERWRGYGKSSFIKSEVHHRVSTAGARALKVLNEKRKNQKLKEKLNPPISMITSVDKIDREDRIESNPNTMLYSEFQRQILAPIKNKNFAQYLKIVDQIVKRNLIQNNGDEQQLKIKLQDSYVQELLTKNDFFSTAKNRSWEKPTTAKKCS